MRTILLALCLGLASLAAAQLGVPSVRLPQLPPVTLPNLPATAVPPGTSVGSSIRVARELRMLRIRELLRRHGDVLEADPHGDPIIRGEVLALAPSAAAVQAAVAAGLSVQRELPLEGLDLRIAVLHTSGATARALQRLQALDPAGTYDFNHIYIDSGTRSIAGASAGRSASAPAPEPADGGPRIS